MLVTMKELLDRAKVRNSCVGAFNVTSLESIQAILGAAEELQEPVILQFAQVHEEVNFMTLDVIGPIMVMMAEEATIPVAVHLDHGVDMNYLKRALDMGFTSIMYDGSSLPYEENVVNTTMAVKMAEKYGASVEAEVGMMSGLTLESDGSNVSNRGIDRSMFTDPAVAKEFVARTGVDCLACAFGSVHGEYKAAPNLDFELVKELDETIGVPVVMHGGSGVSPEDYKKVIEAGVRKVNYYTYMVKAGGEAVRAKMPAEGTIQFHDISLWAIEAMKADVKAAMQVFMHKD